MSPFQVLPLADKLRCSQSRCSDKTAVLKSSSALKVMGIRLLIKGERRKPHLSTLIISLRIRAFILLKPTDRTTRKFITMHPFRHILSAFYAFQVRLWEFFNRGAYISLLIDGLRCCYFGSYQSLSADASIGGELHYGYY